MSLPFLGVDLFSGAGGMTQGAKLAGVDVQFAVEQDLNAARTYSRNHEAVQLYRGDIRTLKEIPIGKRSRQTILFGGPPCQGFSTSNQRTRSKNNKDNWMFREFVRFMKQWRPDWILFENVKGLGETAKGSILAAILTSFEKNGYTLSIGILNAADYGVPQRRERFFIIGSLHGVKVQIPKATTAELPIPVKHALDDLPELTPGAFIDVLPYKGPPHSGYVKQLRSSLKTVSGNLVTRNSKLVIERYKHIRQGENWESIPAMLMRNYRPNFECHTGIYHRLNADKPSVVIGNYRKNMLIHPYQNRGLSVREAARIQSFPDTYVFSGSIGFQQQQVGNAVPPLLAAAVFKEIISKAG